ncbi:APC [Lepeophtheirus salmonis]|uniref:APC n=1 Tax=Lepeophtheirus salmonis TaxID=72036 RepID=A0A7R8CV49_LEPSM|nr:APC [Lepeophtheirus salmonis]CAF2891012.1 APC [Lepeophtheirus salmonis]
MFKKPRRPLVDLPPTWGQDVAPPPTPYFITPTTSPGGSTANSNDGKSSLIVEPPLSTASSSSPPSLPPGSSQHTTSPVSPPSLNNNFFNPHRLFSTRVPKTTQWILDRENPSSYAMMNNAYHNNRVMKQKQLYREALPLHKVALLSHSGPPILQERLMSHSLQRVGGMEHRAPSSVGNTLTNRDKNVSGGGSIPDDTNSVMSFISSVHSVNDNMTTRRREDIDSKIEGVNSLVSLLGCTDIEKMSRTFLAMSSSQAKCDLMRSHHVIPLLVQLLHGNSPRPSKDIRFRFCKREAKVLKLLEVLRLYTDFLRDVLLLEDQGSKKSICSQGCQRIAYRILPDDTILLLDSSPDAMDQMLPDEHYIPCYNFINYSEDTFENDRGSMDRRKGSPLVINVEETMAILTRCSFDEGHRQPIFMLGGIPVLAELIQVEKDAHGSFNDSGHCTEVKRFAVVALTNLTLEMLALRAFFPQLIYFEILLGKRIKSSKQVLSDSRVVQVLMKASMDVMDKLIMDGGGDIHHILGKNKEDICRMDNAFPFLVHLLQQKFPSIVESAGGILRNISSYIATCPNGEAYRVILREHHCLAILLSHLKSPSLTIVSNACGTLWNFSARNEMDQMTLWEMGAVPMLQSLTNSKHKTISTCALAALKNLYSFKPYQQSEMARSPQNGCLPLLEARKKENFLAEMKSQKLTETCNEEDDEDDDSEMSSSSSSESSSEDEKTTPRDIFISPILYSKLHEYVQAEIPDEQPTDYSLRFQEEEEEGPSKNVNPEGNAPSSSAEEGNKNVDCVKTYCTEGTPFDTPFAHISTATSIEDITQAGHDEKPQIYCTEDTPGVFSRADSLSSLDSIENSNNGISSNESNREQLECIDENVEEKKSRDCPLPTPKTVTFHPHETPLMFSRASSVESLNSIEQVSIRDEYSSCDYSRATSGPVSPSDLPDSPCQSRPRTPPISRKGGKADETAPATGASGKQFVNQEERPLPQFINKKTTRTSLSNLTFSDDEDEDKRTQNSSEIFKIIGTFDESECTVEPQRINEPLSLEDEDDDLDSDSESILEAIISSGMPKSTRGPINNAHKQSTSPQATGSKSRLPRPKSSASSSSKTGVLGDAIDSVKRYRTEDTPEEDGGNESEERDLLEACINSAMPKSDTPKIFAAQIPTPLGRREDGEGAPSGPGAVSRHSNVLRSNQNPRAVVKPMPRLNRTVPTPMKRTSKNDAQMQCNTSYQYSLPRLGCDTPRRKESNYNRQAFFITSSKSSGTETSMSNDSLQDESDEALLEDIIKSGMPKSKSEPLGFNQGLKLAKTEFGVKKRDKKKGRDNSKSPRASKIIPGVRIAELRLLPKKSPISPEIKSTSIIEPKDEPRVFDLQCGEKNLSFFSENKKDLEIQDIEIEPSTKVDIKGAVSVLTEDCLSLESSLCSNISMIQPPSIMDSLISMSERKTDVLLPHTAKMECRHTLSAKKGYTVPEMVRRAIGITKAPTILDDMDNSILSIASISSEVACVNMGSSGDSGSNPGQSLNSEQIFELIRPEAEEIHAQCMALSSNAEEEDITTLEDIAPPTLLDELTTTTSKTLVPEIKGADGLTYTVDDPVDGLSTCHDITDVFDDETIEPTLTLGSYGDADEAPELPRDSRHTTPAHSGGESSHESTPQSKRKLVEQYLNYKVSVPSLDDPSPQLSEVHTAASNTTTSGYKSAETTPTKSSRQRRKEDVDRFKTHTITKEDISPRKSDSDSTSSPKSIKQRPQATINNSPSEGSPKVRPRIRKPSEEEPPLSPKSIRGRRKPLYTSPKRSTVPPSIPPKPSIPFRGAGTISSVSRGGIRSRTTSSASLRSSGSSITTATTSRASPRIPLGSSSSTSSVRSTSSRVSNSSVSRVPIKTSSSVIANKPPPLVRQGHLLAHLSLEHPSPSVAQTRTSALRERSASRGSQVTSNSNSSRSSKSSLKTSTSSQSLRTVTESGIPKRAPSNPSIQRYNQQQNLISETRSESGLKRGTNKKEVTSRIASLWKKKLKILKKRNKVKEQQHIRDTKIWISKGKVIPESERALLKVHEEQRKIINEFKSTKEVTTTPREKSRSRLSIRLSKFSLKQKEKTPSPNHEDGEGEDDDKNEPEGVETDKCASSPASAIVQPFNYNPPEEDKKMIPRSRSTVRRNDSYVNSMGRVPPNTKSPTKKETPSSSVMVTLSKIIRLSTSDDAHYELYSDETHVDSYPRKSAVGRSQEAPQIFLDTLNNEDDDEREAFGTVVLGRLNGKRVAVKVVPRVDSTRLNRTDGEVNAKLLTHDNIVHLFGVFYDAVDCNNNIVIVMEYVGKTNLQQLINENKQILNESFIHRLVRCFKSLPLQGNVAFRYWPVCAQDADFLVGTPGYQAPEMLQYQYASDKCDVYSFGVLCWQVIRKEIPYDGVHPHTIVYKVVSENFRPPDSTSLPSYFKPYQQIYPDGFRARGVRSQSKKEVEKGIRNRKVKKEKKEKKAKRVKRKKEKELHVPGRNSRNELHSRTHHEWISSPDGGDSDKSSPDLHDSSAVGCPFGGSAPGHNCWGGGNLLPVDTTGQRRVSLVTCASLSFSRSRSNAPTAPTPAPTKDSLTNTSEWFITRSVHTNATSAGIALGKRFHMENHINSVHIQDKPFHCESCSYKAATKGHLEKKHVKTVHNKEKRFPCEICGNRFGQKIHMQNHMMAIHKKEKSPLVVHIALIDPPRKACSINITYITWENPYKCIQCEASFGTMNNLKIHSKLAHDTLVPVPPTTTVIIPQHPTAQVVNTSAGPINFSNIAVVMPVTSTKLIPCFNHL